MKLFKSNIKTYTLSLLTLSMASCDYDGKIDILKDTQLTTIKTVKVRGGHRSPNRSKKVKTVKTVKQGAYKLKINSKGPFSNDLSLILSQNGKKMHTIPLDVPKGSSLPESGPINIKSNKDINKLSFNGEMLRDVERSNTYSGSESCSKEVVEYVDVRKCDDRGCHWTEENRYRTVRGDRDVEYHYRKVTKTIQGSLKQASNQIGLVTAIDVDNDKIYTYQSRCFIY